MLAQQQGGPSPNAYGGMSPEVAQFIQQMQGQEQSAPMADEMAGSMVTPEQFMGHPTPSLSYDQYLQIAKGLGVDLDAMDTPSTDAFNEDNTPYGYGVSIINLLGGK